MKRLARKQGTQALRELLTADAARLRQGMVPNGSDRCLAAVYPEKTTALDYLPENALVCVEGSRTAGAGVAGGGGGAGGPPERGGLWGGGGGGFPPPGRAAAAAPGGPAPPG